VINPPKPNPAPSAGGQLHPTPNQVIRNLIDLSDFQRIHSVNIR